MPADARQQVEQLPGVHRAARQKVAPAAAVCSFFKAMPFHQPRICRLQGASTCTLALNLARLLRDVTHKLLSREREFSHVFVAMMAREAVRTLATLTAS